MKNNQLVMTPEIRTSLIVFTVIAILGGLSRLLIYTSASSCALQFAISIVLPIAYYLSFPKGVKHVASVTRAMLGFLVGLIGITTFSVAEITQYYFLGGRLLTYSTLGQPLPLPPITVELVVRSFFLYSALWLVRLLACAFVSFLSAWTPTRR